MFQNNFGKSQFLNQDQEQGDDVDVFLSFGMQNFGNEQENQNQLFANEKQIDLSCNYEAECELKVSMVKAISQLTK